MVMVLALVLGCVTALGYKDVSAASWNQMVDQDIELNKPGSFTLTENATVLKFEVPASGSFVIDFTPSKIHAKAQLLNEQGNVVRNKRGKEILGGGSGYSSFEWEELDAGIYYLRIWGTSSNKKYINIEVGFSTRFEASEEVVWEIGISLKKGKSIQLAKIAENCGEKDAHWAPEDKKIATVSEDGTVKAKAVGETYIKLISSSKKVAKIKIIVTKK